MSSLVVVAQIAGRRIAVDAARVRSVIDLADVVSVPGTKPHVLGVTALRSRPMTVIDTCIAIGKSGVGNPVGARALVVEEHGEHYALLVEEVFDVVETEGEPIPVPGDLADGWSGIGSSLIETNDEPALLIDPSSLLGPSTGLAA